MSVPEKNPALPFPCGQNMIKWCMISSMERESVTCFHMQTSYDLHHNTQISHKSLQDHKNLEILQNASKKAIKRGLVAFIKSLFNFSGLSLSDPVNTDKYCISLYSMVTAPKVPSKNPIANMMSKMHKIITTTLAITRPLTAFL